jgi:hypothetical protein
MSIPKDESGKIIPEQYKGGQTGANESLEASDAAAAAHIFSESKRRMQDINNWQNICEGLSAEFCLTDVKGTIIHTIPAIGNLIRISLPAPGLAKGDGYDWVRIEAIEEEGNAESQKQLFSFRVRPVVSPNLPEGSAAHMYRAEATSSFILYRLGNIVYAAEEGRNEIPNIEVEKITDKIRNAVVAFSAMIGLAVPQWKKLMRGILGIK